MFAECDKDWLPASDAGRVWRSLSSGEMVYIRSASKTEELYNVAADPAQLRNLAATPGARTELEHLRTAMDRFLAGARGPGKREQSTAPTVLGRQSTNAPR